MKMLVLGKEILPTDKMLFHSVRPDGTDGTMYPPDRWGSLNFRGLKNIWNHSMWFWVDRAVVVDPIYGEVAP